RSRAASGELQSRIQSRAAVPARRRPRRSARRLSPRDRHESELRRGAFVPREGISRRRAESGRGRAPRAQRPRAGAALGVRAARPLRHRRRVLAAGPAGRCRTGSCARPGARAGPPSLGSGGPGARPQESGAAGAPVVMPRAAGKSVSEPRPSSVLIIGSEAVPFAKTGGLADVLGALPLALARLGWRVTLALPRYRGSADGTLVERFAMTIGGSVFDVGFFDAPLAAGAKALLVH